MTDSQRQLERDAIDEAMQTQIGLLFSVLCACWSADGSDTRFINDLAQTREAHEFAVDAINRKELP